MTHSWVGPDIAIVGSARSGSTFLAGLLADSPLIDSPAVKEPDYFSFNFLRGPEWYDAMFPPRQGGHLRLDASVSYTYTEANGALARLAEASPGVRVLYLVREPVERMVSHFLHYRDYAGLDANTHLGAALEGGYDYAGASDYALWLKALEASFEKERILVVPFAELTADPQHVLDTVLRWLGVPLKSVQTGADMFRNASVRPRNRLIGQVVQRVLASPAYPGIRKSLGATRIRKIRQFVTRESSVDLEAELATLAPAQQATVEEMRLRAIAAVTRWLVVQDPQTGTQWVERWLREETHGDR